MDAMAKWFAQTYQPSRERIKSEQAQEYNKEAQQKYMDVVREKAKILEIRALISVVSNPPPIEADKGIINKLTVKAIKHKPINKPAKIQI